MQGRNRIHTVSQKLKWKVLKGDKKMSEPVTQALLLVSSDNEPCSQHHSHAAALQFNPDDSL